MRYSQDHMSPSEAFARGFWGGIGFFCGFMVLNIVVAIVGIMLLMSMGGIIRANTPADAYRSTFSLSGENGSEASSERIERTLPLRAPARGRQSE